MKLLPVLAGLGALSLAAPALTHHSAVAFDKSKTVEVSGEVTRFVWRNPHMAINMEVTDASGNTALWKIEGPGTAVLSRQGFNRSSINTGDKITVVVNPLRVWSSPGGLLAGDHAGGRDLGMRPARTTWRRRRQSNDQRVVQTIPSLLDYVPPPDGRDLAGTREARRDRRSCRWSVLTRGRPDPAHWIRSTWRRNGPRRRSI